MALSNIFGRFRKSEQPQKKQPVQRPFREDVASDTLLTKEEMKQAQQKLETLQGHCEPISLKAHTFVRVQFLCDTVEYPKDSELCLSWNINKCCSFSFTCEGEAHKIRMNTTPKNTVNVEDNGGVILENLPLNTPKLYRSLNKTAVLRLTWIGDVRS